MLDFEIFQNFIKFFKDICGRTKETALGDIYLKKWILL